MSWSNLNNSEKRYIQFGVMTLIIMLVVLWSAFLIARQANIDIENDKKFMNTCLEDHKYYKCKMMLGSRVI